VKDRIRDRLELRIGLGLGIGLGLVLTIAVSELGSKVDIYRRENPYPRITTGLIVWL